MNTRGSVTPRQEQALLAERLYGRDPRYLFAILGGVATLYTCQACVLGRPEDFLRRVDR